MSVAAKPMTLEEFLALPDDGVERDLIRGELRDYPITTRSGAHCVTLANLSWLVGDWVRRQDRPRGRVYSGDARVRLRRDPDTFVGSDLVYLSPRQAESCSPEAGFVGEPPTLVDEITSPSDTAEGIAEKVREYLAAGVSLVWEVNPLFRTVTVHRPDAPPVLFNTSQELTAEPHLPGIRAAVTEVFAA